MRRTLRRQETGDRRQGSENPGSAAVLSPVSCLLSPVATRRPGLSLIEVLLSMAIFFIAIVAISRLVDVGTDSELEARLHTTASRLAQAKLAEVEAGVESLEATGGEFGEAEPGWTWQMTAESQVPNLYLVSVTVSRDLKGRPFTLKLSQMILDPAVKGAAAEAARPTAATGGMP